MVYKVVCLTQTQDTKGFICRDHRSCWCFCQQSERLFSLELHFFNNDCRETEGPIKTNVSLLVLPSQNSRTVAATQSLDGKMNCYLNPVLVLQPSGCMNIFLFVRTELV